EEHVDAAGDTAHPQVEDDDERDGQATQPVDVVPVGHLPPGPARRRGGRFWGGHWQVLPDGSAGVGTMIRPGAYAMTARRSRVRLEHREAAVPTLVQSGA